MGRSSADAAESKTDPDALLVLLGDWQVHLRARNISPATIDSYVRVGRAFL